MVSCVRSTILINNLQYIFLHGSEVIKKQKPTQNLQLPNSKVIMMKWIRVIAVMICSSKVSFRAAQPSSFLPQSKQTQQLRKNGYPMTVQLLTVCLMLKIILPFSLDNTRSFIWKWIMLVSRSISIDVSMMVWMSSLLEFRHYMQESGLILHLRVDGKNLEKMSVMIWLGKAMYEELRVKMMRLSAQMLFSQSWFQKTRPCILGNFPYLSSFSSFTLTIEERPFSAKRWDNAPMVTTFLSLPRQTDIIFSFLSVRSKSSHRNDFSELLSNLSDTAPSHTLLTLGVMLCALMKLLAFRVILSLSPMIYSPNSTTSIALLR